MNFPNDETGQVLSEMQQAGIDLSQSYEVIFFHLFEKQAQAQAMADFITETMPDMCVKIQPDESPNVWDVDCSITFVPSYQAVIEYESKLEKIAEQFSGYGDGWGIEA